VHPSFARLDHRPWPLPSRPWRWRQRWSDLLFAHWAVPADWLRPLVPAALELEERDGSAWLAVVPFRMVDVAPRGLPSLPGLSTFPEVNVRTYVSHGGRPGVWFLSLDATQPVAVWAAQHWFHLPYWRASVRFREDAGGWIDYRAERHPGAVRQAGPAALAVRYRPLSPAYEATPGTLEHWLTERYCLYAQAKDGRLWRSEVHHLPWPLQRAELELERNEMFAAHRLSVPARPDLVHFARDLAVAMWRAEPVE
jgi:uncharacterized protein YqjF (DUF2071 family)